MMAIAMIAAFVVNLLLGLPLFLCLLLTALVGFLFVDRRCSPTPCRSASSAAWTSSR